MSVLETTKFVKLVIGGEEIICTPEHPFSVKDKGFTEAGNLKQGDLVHNKDFETLAVEKVEHFETKEPTKVYNFTVEDYHTYFVGSNRFIVHNAGGFSGANGWYNAKALEFTNNATSNQVVLGRSMDGYNTIARSKNATYFYSKNWSTVHDMFGVGDKGMWRVNKAFLKQQIAAGKQFVFVSNPAIGPEGYFVKEVAFLLKYGVIGVL